MQSSFGTWFVRVHFRNARWSHARVNQHGLRSRNKILPRSAQILIVIGTAFAVLVNARSSNHDPNHENTNKVYIKLVNKFYSQVLLRCTASFWRWRVKQGWTFCSLLDSKNIFVNLTTMGLGVFIKIKIFKENGDSVFPFCFHDQFVYYNIIMV